jgi:glycosyltransferase involved in cell wall biosynthesis
MTDADEWIGTREASALAGSIDARTTLDTEIPGRPITEIRANIETLAVEEDELVTVVLPVFNALSSNPEYLPFSIGSVITQTHRNLELIIVDDGSTDDYAELRSRITDKRITWLRQDNAGQSAARNLGARAGSGVFLAFIDQDDRWYANWLETALAEARKSQSAFVYCDVDRMDAAGRVTHRAFFSTTARGTYPKQRLAQVIGQDCYVMPSGMFMNRAQFLALGGFNEVLAGCEDDDLFRRFFCNGECHFIATPLVRWRQTTASSSHSQRMDESRLCYFEILKAAYPDRPERSEMMLCDLVAPRFLDLFIGVYREAAAARNFERLALARKGLESVRPHLRPRLRAGLAIILAMPTALLAFWQKAAFNSRLYDGLVRMLGRR